MAAEGRGKKRNQKIKPYVVLQYLLKYTDENNIATAPEIVAFLEEHDIDAERRSIYSDIKQINRVALMLEEDCSIDDAEEMLEDDADDELKLVVYDPHQKGFYVRQRHFDLNDIRLLAECIYPLNSLPKDRPSGWWRLYAISSASIRQSASGIMPSLLTG